ncbi:MAG: mechanosensitive ion channel domain-containing protein, partial [Methanobacteriota archaeon]
IMERAILRGVKDYKAKYSFKKIASTLYIVGFLIALAAIWIENPETLFVAIGVIGAGIAIALQDFFKNFAGGMLIFASGLYKVGDRVEIGSRVGDVIDIGVFYTTLMEARGWVSGDQVTGRLTTVPNGVVLATPVNNYTKDHNFIWDEITIPVTYDSDWKGAHDKFLAILQRETAECVKAATEGLSRIKDNYYVDQVRNLEPAIYMTLTDNWIALDLRYVVETRQRRVIRNILMRFLLEAVEASGNIKIASTTSTITTLRGEEFPKAEAKGAQ